MRRTAQLSLLRCKLAVESEFVESENNKCSEYDVTVSTTCSRLSSFRRLPVVVQVHL